MVLEEYGVPEKAINLLECQLDCQTLRDLFQFRLAQIQNVSGMGKKYIQLLSHAVLKIQHQYNL
jgi:hypothetical protein